MLDLLIVGVICLVSLIDARYEGRGGGYTTTPR